MNSPKILLTSLAIAGSVVLFSCGGEAPEANTGPKYDYERADSLDLTYLKNLGVIRVSIEQTAKLNQALKNMGNSYNSGAMNSASKASSYSSTKAQAVNLGVFGSDLNYASAYDQGNDVRKYLDALMELSKKMGVESAFNAELITQIAEGDSTVNKSNLLTKAYLNARDQMYSDDRAKMVTYMVVGGWVEGMHLALEAVKSKPGNKKVNEGLWSLTFTYDNIIKMLEAFGNDADCQALLADMQKVKGPKQALIKSKGGNISPAVIDKMSAGITELRSSLVN